MKNTTEDTTSNVILLPPNMFDSLNVSREDLSVNGNYIMNILDELKTDINNVNSDIKQIIDLYDLNAIDIPIPVFILNEYMQKRTLALLTAATLIIQSDELYMVDMVGISEIIKGNLRSNPDSLEAIQDEQILDEIMTILHIDEEEHQFSDVRM